MPWWAARRITRISSEQCERCIRSAFFLPCGLVSRRNFSEGNGREECLRCYTGYLEMKWKNLYVIQIRLYLIPLPCTLRIADPLRMQFSFFGSRFWNAKNTRFQKTWLLKSFCLWLGSFRCDTIIVVIFVDSSISPDPADLRICRKISENSLLGCLPDSYFWGRR